MRRKYSSYEDVEKIAKSLMGKSIKEIDTEDRYLDNTKSKGKIGQVVQWSGFGLELDSSKEADFREHGIELKVTGYNWVYEGKKVSAKERLTLSIIDFMKEVDIEFMESGLTNSLLDILMVFYEYEKDKPEEDFIISNFYRFVFDTIPEKDRLIIIQDWQKISDKIKAGKAHELSEGDTEYLGAARKGANNEEALREQPYSNIKAKQRAFSLKTKYMTHLLRTYVFHEVDNREEFIKDISELRNNTFEEIIESRFNKFKGKTLDEINQDLDINIDRSSNHYLYRYASSMLGVKSANTSQEFKNANIKVKTIRVGKNNIIKESMSFPQIDFMNFSQTNWEDSAECEMFENAKYIFVIFDEIDDKEKSYRFRESVLWNMPIDDINTYVKPVYEEVYSILNNELIIESYNSRDHIRNNFPSSDYNNVCHIRPHGKNSYDIIPLPETCNIIVEGKPSIKTKLYKENHSFSKQSFWLHKDYILKQIEKSK